MRVVHGAVLKRFGCQAASDVVGHRTIAAQTFEDALVIARIGQHHDRGKVLCRGAQQRMAANVDVLQGDWQLDRRVTRDGQKRVQVGDNDVDGLETVLRQLVEVAGSSRSARMPP